MLKNEKVLKNFYITSGLQDVMKEILIEKGWKKSMFAQRALDLFINNPKRTVDDDLFIKKKDDPNYVPRNVLENAWIDKEQFNKLLEICKEYNDCSYSILIFQAFYDYCILVKCLGR